MSRLVVIITIIMAAHKRTLQERSVCSLYENLQPPTPTSLNKVPLFLKVPAVTTEVSYIIL